MAHAFHIFDRDYFMEHEHFWDWSENNPSLYEIPDIEAIDIDEPVDFLEAEMLYRISEGSTDKLESISASMGLGK